MRILSGIANLIYAALADIAVAHAGRSFYVRGFSSCVDDDEPPTSPLAGAMKLREPAVLTIFATYDGPHEAARLRIVGGDSNPLDIAEDTALKPINVYDEAAWYGLRDPHLLHDGQLEHGDVLPTPSCLLEREVRNGNIDGIGHAFTITVAVEELIKQTGSYVQIANIDGITVFRGQPDYADPRADGTAYNDMEDEMTEIDAIVIGMELKLRAILSSLRREKRHDLAIVFSILTTGGALWRYLILPMKEAALRFDA